MTTAQKPINDAFPSPDEIANKHIKQLAEDLQYSEHCKLWIKGKYQEYTGGDKATVKVLANYVAGVEVLYPIFVGKCEDNERMFKSHEVNMKAFLELRELKEINKIFFDAIKAQYPTEYMQICNLFGISKATVKPKFFKEL
jgi:hypothetical protein